MDDTSTLANALALAHESIENPKKNKTVRVATRDGREYGFSYADLSAVIDAIRVPLAKNGLSIVQMLEQDEQGKFRLLTALYHSSGQCIQSRWPLFVEDGTNQKFGSALTFMRRYSISALLCLAADDDDDGNVADGQSAAPAPPVRKYKPVSPGAGPGGSASAAPEPPKPAAEASIPELEAKLAAAAETGDRESLQTVWDSISLGEQYLLRPKLTGVYWPRLREREKEIGLASRDNRPGQ